MNSRGLASSPRGSLRRAQQRAWVAFRENQAAYFGAPEAHDNPLWCYPTAPKPGFPIIYPFVMSIFASVEVRAAGGTREQAGGFLRVPAFFSAWWAVGGAAEPPLGVPLLRAWGPVPAGWLAVAVLAGGLLYWLGRHRRTRHGHEHDRARQAQIRSSIAADLHDELGSLLMRIHVEAESMLAPDHDARLERLLANTRAAASALRDVAWGLDASADTVGALQDRMRDLLDQLALSTPLRTTLATEGLDAAAALPPRLRQDVYMVFKEATTNVVRHAGGASYLATRLYRHGPGLVLEVEDDGAPVVPAGRSGMGLRNMALRAQAAGGRLEAAPRPDGPGFRVWLWVPLGPGGPPPGRAQRLR